MTRFATLSNRRMRAALYHARQQRLQRIADNAAPQEPEIEYAFSYTDLEFETIADRVVVDSEDFSGLSDRNFILTAIIQPDNWSGTEGIIGKYAAGSNDRSFLLRLNNAIIEFIGSTNGSATTVMFQYDSESPSEPVKIEIERIDTSIVIRIDDEEVDDYELGSFVFDDNEADTVIGDYDVVGTDRHFEGSIPLINLQFTDEE